MKIKTIGIDLDETLVKFYPVLKEIFKRNNMKYRPFRTLSGDSIPEYIVHEIQQALKNPDIMCNLKPYPYVAGKLYLLKKKGYKLIIITARHESIKGVTVQWLKKIFPAIDEVIITPPEFKIKRDILVKNKVHLWIDDNPIEIEDIMKHIPCIMVSNKNTLYNHYLRDKVQFIHYFSRLNPVILSHKHKGRVYIHPD